MICGSAGAAGRIRAEACTASDSGPRSGRLRTRHIGIPDHSPTKTRAAGIFTQPGQLDHLIDPAAADPAVRASASRLLRADRPGCTDRASSKMPSSAIGAARLGVVLAVDPHRPAVRPVQAGDHPHRGGFPRPVRARGTRSPHPAPPRSSGRRRRSCRRTVWSGHQSRSLSVLPSMCSGLGRKPASGA